MPLSNILQPDDSIDPKEVSGKEVLKNLKELLDNKESRTQLVNAITNAKTEKRPPNWAKSSNPPYYRERFAVELRKHLDEMMTDHEDRLYRYEDFTWLSKNSLYLMLNQALRYLLDHLDHEGKYAAYRQMISITRERDRFGASKGIRFSIAKDIRSGGAPPFISTKVRDKEDAWRTDMENFIEEAEEGSEFEIKKLALSPEEIYELEVFLGGFSNILANIGPSSIKLVKISSL